jgi:hypothetical protein
MGKRRWRARTPKPFGASLAPIEREASWSAEHQFRFGSEAVLANRQGEVAKREVIC